MPSNTYAPSIEQGALLQFQDNFQELAQQTDSYLMNSGAIFFLPSGGKTNNMARIGRTELVLVEGRNPDKQYSDYAIDNRLFSKKRYTRTFTIDAKDDINELLKDPTSDLLRQLDHAKNRVVDRVAIAAALGPVLVGGPDTAPSSISAATDGVVTVDATGGLTYAKWQEIIQKFINNDLSYPEFSGSTFAGTGKENTALMSEDKFINNFYIDSKPVDKGVQTKAGAFQIALFAGSENGGITVPAPVLPEVSTVRKCAVLTPKSIAMAMEVALTEVARNPNKVNSFDITMDLWIEAMRTEGARVIQVNTTI